MEDSVSSVDIPAVSQAKMVINILIKTAANTADLDSGLRYSA